MIRTMATITILTAAAVVGFANAGAGASFKIGDSAPEFKDLPGADGKTYSSGDFKQDVLVIVITCNQCPVAMAYEERMIDLAKKYATGKDAKVGFVAINVNRGEHDKLDAMTVRAKSKGFNFPYLHDQSQKIARQLDAHVTPEFYVFDKSRKLVYWGPLDDNLDVTKIAERYLEPAIDAVLAGKTVPTAQKKAFGCSVDYQK